MPRPERSWSKLLAWMAAAATTAILLGAPAQGGQLVELPGVNQETWWEGAGWEPVPFLSESAPAFAQHRFTDGDAPDFRPAVVEFPVEEFSFSLVEYSTPLRVVENQMLFRFELPGVGRALVSCEFIF